MCWYTYQWWPLATVSRVENKQSALPAFSNEHAPIPALMQCETFYDDTITVYVV